MQKRKMSLYCQHQRVESFGEHDTKEVCVLSRTLVDGVPDQPMERTGEKQTQPAEERSKAGEV